MNTKNRHQKGLLRYIVYFLAAILVIILFILGSLPTILSLNPVRRMVLKQAQGAIHGSIQIQSWSFGWFSGVSLKGIEFDDGKGMRATVKQMTMSSGLIRLIGKTMDFGSVVVEEPEISMLVKKTPGKKEAIPGKTEPSESPGSVKVIRVGALIKGLFKVQNGQVMISTEEGTHPLLLEKLNTSLAIKDLRQPVILDFSVIQGENLGEIRGTASIKILKDSIFNPREISGDMHMDIEGLELGPISDVAVYLAEIPRAGGELNSKISAHLEGQDRITTNGHIQLESLTLSGGPLGKDTPSFDIVTLDFNLGRDGRSLGIKTFEFHAPFAGITASGGLQDEGKKYPAGAISINGQVDLARILSELPHTLKIKEGLRMSSGHLVFGSEIKSTEDGMALKSDIKISDIKGRRAAQTFAMDSPISLCAEAIATEKGPRIEHLELSSAFATASGKGDLNDLGIDLSVDLEKSIKELGKFVDMGKLLASGTMTAKARITSQDQYTKTCELDITTNQLSLKGLTPRPVKQNSIQAHVTGELNLSEEGKPQDLKTIDVQLKSSVLSTHIGIQSLGMPSQGEYPSVENLTATAMMQLDKALELAQNIGMMEPGLSGSGLLKLECQGGLKEGTIHIPSLTADMTDMILDINGKKISEPSVRLKTAINANPSKREATLRDLSMGFSSGQVTVPIANLKDWSKLPAEIEGKGSIIVNLGKLVSTLSAFEPIPKGSKLSGSARCDLEASPAETAQNMTLAMVIDKLKFISKSGQVFEEGKGQLYADARIDMASDQLHFDSLAIETSPLNVKGSGKLTDLSKTKGLHVKGILECDFSRIGDIVETFSGKKVEVEGKKAQDFFIQTSLAGKTWADTLKKTEASAGIFIKRLKTFGVEARDMETRLDIKDSRAKVLLRTKVNEGILNITPVLDVRGEPPVLTVPEDSKILDGVNLTDEMATELLALIHPIFRGGAIMGGQVGMLLKDARVPLDEKMKQDMVISGDIELKEVILVPSGLLKSLLTTIKLEPTPGRISDQTISFVCQNGRVEPSPLTIRADGYEIVLSGTMTYDGMVNYVAEVPVTQKMVSQDIYKYVKNARLKVLIEGPVSKPRISRKSMNETLSNLVKEAAKNLLMEKGGDLLKQLFKNR